MNMFSLDNVQDRLQVLPHQFVSPLLSISLIVVTASMEEKLHVIQTVTMCMWVVSIYKQGATRDRLLLFIALKLSSGS
jgi:hypothetical protein